MSLKRENIMKHYYQRVPRKENRRNIPLKYTVMVFLLTINPTLKGVFMVHH